jgi:large subunit ribosomal protein L4
MLEIALLNEQGKDVEKISASEKIFGLKLNKQVIYDVLRWFMASKRRGTHSTLTRAEVSGGGKKPWRQKGTGRARAGSIRSPLWRKGGVVFGPKPRDYGYSLPIKVRKLALAQVLSQRLREGKIKLIEKLEIPEVKTKLAKNLLKNLGVSGKILVLLSEDNGVFGKACRNLSGVVVNSTASLNIVDLLHSEWMVMEKGVFDKLEGKLR